MLFNSVEFILFFLVVYVAYRFMSHRAQNLLLLGASYFFYGCWDWRFLFLLLVNTVVDYVCGLKINRAAYANERKAWLILSLCVSLGILGFFKYFNFFSASLETLLGIGGLHLHPFTLKILLPVGISFYTFQSISYIVDVYLNKIKPEKDFFIYALFVAFFPQLVAGPIERAAHMLPQYKTPRTLTDQKNKEGAWFVFWGFFLKIFVADNMAKIADLVFSQSGMLPAVEVLLGTYAFAFQVFGDFAGYSFIAMGIARLLGFDLMINFMFPYFVTNPRDFWRHWHVSLSSWLRDYLYIPLGGNRKGEAVTYRNLLLTMTLGGLWHGAAWTYVIWGFYQGMTLGLHRVFRNVVPAKVNPSGIPWISDFFKAVLMFQVTCLGWLMFRANSVEQLMDFLLSLWMNSGVHSDKAFYLAGQIIFFSALLMIVQGIQKHKNDLMAIPKLRGLMPWVFYLTMFYLLVVFGEFGGKQFIYFQF